MSNRVPKVNQKAIAEVFGVSRETIRKWVKDGLPMRDGGYVVADCVQWRRDQDRAESVNETAPDEAKERARKMRADADLSELRVRQMRGELVAVSTHERELERLCMVLRARVLSIRGRWAPRVMGLGTMAEATAVLDALAADVLAAMREGADDLEDDGEESEGAAA